LRIEGWASDGLTNEQIAKNIGICRDTLNEWCKKFPVISDAIKKGRRPACVEVENAMFKSALGYTVTIRKPVKIKTKKQLSGKGTIEEEHIEYVEEEVHVPANTLAQIYILKNRRPDKWRDKPVDVAENSKVTVIDDV